MKKVFSLVLCFLIIFNVFVVYGVEEADWRSLYKAKIDELVNEYKSGTRDALELEMWGDRALFFSVQDINFDGVPEMYHTVCSWFEQEPHTSGKWDEIYYIKDGQVLKGTIQAEGSLGLLPMEGGKRARVEERYEKNIRWQYVMRSWAIGENCFITNDSYSGFKGEPERRFSRLFFDTKTGVLSAETLFLQEESSYETGGERHLEGYDPIGVDGYTYNGTVNDRDFNEWKPVYIAPKVLVNDKYVEFDNPPFIVEDRTLVPVRRIAEALGCQVDWDDTERTATIVKDDITAVMRQEDNTYYVNGQPYTMDVTVKVLGGRTFIPVRALSECLGCTVNWDENTETVIISE